MAGSAALKYDLAERDERMSYFRKNVHLLAHGLNKIEGIRCLEPTGTFYLFPSVAKVCNKLGITSHGLAMFLLQGADPDIGVASLGGECFGQAGAGFIRFSVSEPPERLTMALKFIERSLTLYDRLKQYLIHNPCFQLPAAYEE